MSRKRAGQTNNNGGDAVCFPKFGPGGTASKLVPLPPDGARVTTRSRKPSTRFSPSPRPVKRRSKFKEPKPKLRKALERRPVRSRPVKVQPEVSEESSKGSDSDEASGAEIVEEDDLTEEGPEVQDKVDLNPELGGLTEGCFILSPKDGSNNFDGDGIPFRPLLSGRENTQLAKVRYSNYLTLLEKVEKIAQEQLLQTQNRSFDGILSHLFEQFSKYNELKAEALESQNSIIQRPNPSLHSLDVLVVRHGSNRADANPLYDHLLHLLQMPEDNIGETGAVFDVRVSDIQQKSLNPSVDSIMKSLFVDWLSPKTSYEPQFAIGFEDYKSMPQDLKLFGDWFAQFKADHKTERQEIFVVLLRDYQLMDLATLQDLIRILSLYRPSLPIWAILGASASPIPLDSLLPQGSLAQVNIQTFDLVDPHRAFMEILEQLFVKSNSIKLNVTSFQLLFDTFNDFTHSITTFLKSLKYALMDHFYSNPLSVLYCTQPPLQHEHCELIRMLPSFRGYINGLVTSGLTSTIQDALENDLHLLNKVIPPMLSRIQAYHSTYPAAFQCFMYLQSWVSKHPCPGTKPHFHSSIALYNANLKTNVVQLSLFSSLMASLASCRTQDIQGLLDGIIRHIKHAPMVDGKDSPQAWAAELATFRDSLDKSKDQSVTKLTTLLKQFFHAMLPSYRSLPLHEIFYYAKAELLEKTFNPQPQAALEFALTRPRVYLPTPASRQGGAPPVPDAAIAYRLYKEAGRLVNIYDWLKAFEHLVVKQHHKLGSKPPTPVDIQARFAQCLNELKFLGYIQTTQRKTDHVQKLTWN